MVISDFTQKETTLGVSWAKSCCWLQQAVYVTLHEGCMQQEWRLKMCLCHRRPHTG